MKKISILLILSSLLAPLSTSSILFARGRGLAIPVVETNVPNVVPWAGAISNNKVSVITTTVQTNEVDVTNTVGLFASWDGRREHVLLKVYPKPPEQAPILSSPDNYIVTYSPRETLSWSSVARAGRYEICISPEGNTPCSGNVSYQTNYRANLDNFRGKLVYWKVRGSNNGPNGRALAPGVTVEASE